MKKITSQRKIKHRKKQNLCGACGWKAFCRSSIGKNSKNVNGLPTNGTFLLNLEVKNFPKNKKGKFHISAKPDGLKGRNMVVSKRVEIKKSVSQCKVCTETAEMYNQITHCSEYHKQKGEWIDTISNIWGTKAVVILDDGRVEHFPLYRLRVITKREA